MQKFKLELDILTGTDESMLTTLKLYYKSLKLLRQSSQRKGAKYMILGERKYTQNESGEYEPFVVFGKSIVPLSVLKNAVQRLELEELEKSDWDMPQTSCRVKKQWN